MIKDANDDVYERGLTVLMKDQHVTMIPYTDSYNSNIRGMC